MYIDIIRKQFLIMVCYIRIYHKYLHICLQFLLDLYQSAITEYRYGNIESSFEKMKEAISLAPMNSEYLFALGCLYYTEYSDKQSRLEALKYFKKSYKYNPKSNEALFRIGDIQHELGLINEARSIYERILSNNEYHADANHRMGYIHFVNNDKETATKYFKKVLSVQPEHPEANFHYGKILLENGQLKKAIEHLKIAEDFIESFDLQYSLAKAYSQLNLYSLALEHYYEAVMANNVPHIIHKEFAEILEKVEDYSLAIEQWREAIKKNPVETTLVTKLAMAYLKNNDIDSCKNALTKALEHCPTDEELLLSAIDIYKTIGDHETSSMYLKRLQRVNPKYASNSEANNDQ